MRKTVLPIVLLALATPALASQPGEPVVPASGASLRAQSSHAPISWSHLQEEIAKTVCVLSTQVEGREYLAPVAGFRKECGQPDAATPVARAVDRAFEQAGMLIGSLKPPGLEGSLKPGLPAEERTRIARKEWLSFDPFLRALLPRLRKALEASGISCSDCPEPPGLVMRMVTWKEIRPYVAAVFWPDPPRTYPTDPTDRSRYSFHICTGENGISEMQNPDPLFVRIGFFVVMGAQETQERAGMHMEEILDEEAFKELPNDAERTRYLRLRLPEEMGKDEIVRAAVCRQLDGLKEDLGLFVTDCTRAAAADGPLQQ